MRCHPQHTWTQPFSRRPLPPHPQPHLHPSTPNPAAVWGESGWLWEARGFLISVLADLGLGSPFRKTSTATYAHRRKYVWTLRSLLGSEPNRAWTAPHGIIVSSQRTRSQAQVSWLCLWLARDLEKPVFPSQAPAPDLNSCHLTNPDAEFGLRKNEGGVWNKDTDEVQGKVTDVEKRATFGAYLH